MSTNKSASFLRLVSNHLHTGSSWRNSEYLAAAEMMINVCQTSFGSQQSWHTERESGAVLQVLYVVTGTGQRVSRHLQTLIKVTLDSIQTIINHWSKKINVSCLFLKRSNFSAHLTKQNISYIQVWFLMQTHAFLHLPFWRAWWLRCNFKFTLWIHSCITHRCLRYRLLVYSANSISKLTIDWILQASVLWIFIEMSTSNVNSASYILISNNN